MVLKKPNSLCLKVLGIKKYWQFPIFASAIVGVKVLNFCVRDDTQDIKIALFSLKNATFNYFYLILITLLSF